MIRKIVFLLVLSVSSIFSQDLINWSSTLIFPTYPSPYISDWERNPDVGTLILSYYGTAPVKFYQEVIVTIDGYGEAIRGKTAAREYTYGPITETLTFNDFSNWEETTYNKDLERLVIQTGKLPESSYNICVNTYALDGTLLAEGCTDFDIALPNPPQLITPEDEGSIQISQPTFMWSPVSTPPSMDVFYKVKIVELLKGQTAFRAMEANVPVVDAEIEMLSTYVYRIDDYPLEQNHTYAWQIQATNDEGVPVSTNEGFSEIWQFTYGSPAGEIGIDTLMLIEDFAYLIDLGELEITDNTVSLELNGSCRMLIKNSNGVDKYIDVFAQNLMLQKDTYDDPIFLAGNVLGSIAESVLPKTIVGEYFRPTDLEFLPPNQLKIAGNFFLGEDVDVPLNGRLDYLDGELSGDVSLMGDAENPLFTFGDESFKMNITSVSLSYPSMETKLDGGLSLFGNTSTCLVNDITLNKKGEYSVAVNCDINQEIALLKDSNLFNLNVNSIDGTISGSFLTGKTDYTVTLDGGLSFNVDEENNFSADVVFELKPNKFELISFDPSGEIEIPTLDLGWVKWGMKDLDLKSLSFTNGNWDFDLAMNIDLSFPNFDFGDSKIPTLSGISFNPKGFNFPKIDINNFSIPNINFSGFALELYGIHIPKFNFDLASWTPGSIAKMGFNFDMKFSMPNLPNGTDDGFKFPNWDFKGASIFDGNFSFNLPSIKLPDVGFPSGINIPMPNANGLSFNIISFGGKLNTNYNGSIMDFLPDVNISGSLTLPDALQCEDGETHKIDASVKLNGNGSISGIVENIIPKCPINIGLASLYMKSSKVEFKLEEDAQKIILDGSAGIKFTKDPNQDEVGKIAVTYEVLGNELIKAEGEIKEDFQWDLPSANPALKFEISEALLHDKKITIDGRSEMKLSGETMGVTFDNFQFDLANYKITNGQIIFDQPFAFSVTGLEDNEIKFAAIKKGEIPTVESFLYFEIPTQVKLNKDGFSLVGESTAIINFQGKRLGEYLEDATEQGEKNAKESAKDLLSKFSDDFAFSLSPFEVSQGQCDIVLGGNRVGYINSSGFYPDPNFFMVNVVPEKLPLPSLDIAYLQIKQGDNLLVDLSTEGNSTRFSTKENEPVELVFPSLQFEAATAPKILVNFSIAIDNTTGEVTDGYIRGVVPDESMQAFDLSQVGIPYAIKSIYYGNIENVSKFEFTGTPKLFDVEFPCSDSLKLTFSQAGVLEGTLNTCALNKSVALIPNSDKLNLIVNTIAGNFSADIRNSNYDFDLTVNADIDFKMSETKTYKVGAVLEADKDGVRLLSSRIPEFEIPKIDLSQFQIEMGNFSIGKLAFGPDPENPLTNKWDFSFGMDLDFSFPDLGLEIPNIPNVTLDMTGFHTMDAISLPSFPDSLGFEFGGIEIKPLAFRMPKLDFNWFDPLNSSFGDGFKFDLEINFPNLADASSAMKYPKLSMIDADFLSGIFVGDIELADFDLLDNMKLNLGGSLGFNIKGISGGFFDDNGTQGVGFNFKGDLELPDFMRCEGSPSSVDMADVSFSLNSLGQVKGSVANFVPTCPIDLGFGKFNVTSSSIAFDIAESKQTALLDMTGDLVVKTGESSTVTASGAVIMDLLTGEITEGSIAINDPFIWSIPNDKPVFSFTINSALLNKDGLLINGGSNLKLPGNQQISANFNQFLFDYRNLKVKSGDLTIDGGFALKLALKDGGIKWSAVNTNTELTENKTAIIGFTSDLVLDKDGLAINGDAIAKIKWDDNPEHQFGDLAIKYSDDFKFSIKPFKVSNGSADLEYNNDVIATIDENGLSLGNIFGLIPIPENIPLPSMDIAYLKIKRGENLLVQSAAVDKGMRIFSSEDSPVSLFLPALQSEGGDLDSIAVVFDVVINTTTGQIVDGAILIAREDSTSLINLRDRGIPVDLYKISYGKVDGNYELTADANIDIPNVLADFPINMHGIKFNNLGLSGSVNLGTYSETYNDELTPLQKASLGEQAIITLEGLDVAFGENFNVGFSGKFIPTMLINDTDTTQIQYAANWNGEESKFAFSFDFADGEKFNFGIGTFKPVAVGENPAMKLSLMEDDFELLLNGEFKSTQFGDDFALGIEGLKITKNSVSANDISIPDVANAIQFKLFNSGFKIFDVPNIPNSKAVKFTYSDGVLKLALSGELKIFDHTTTFSNFTIGTDGTFSIGSVNLLDQDLTIVENYLALNNLGIADNKLAVGGWAKLPKPVGNDKQFDFAFNIAADGTVTSNETIGNKIVFFDELQGIGGGDNTEYDFWKAKFDPTYLALNLNFDAIDQSSVKMVADVYWDNNKDKRIAIGDKSNKNDIKPGLEIKFNGDVTWGTISDLDDIISFKAEMLEVGMQSIALPTTTPDLSFSIGGTVGLNFDAVSGGLEIAGFEFNSDGVKDVGSITGGTLEIVDVASLSLTSLEYSDTPTTISVSGGSMPTGNGAATTGSTDVEVNSYFSFGGEITIEGLASGGVERVLAYTTDNSSTLIIEDAHLKVDGVLEFNLDLVYHNGEDSFKIIAGGSGNIASFDATIVGKFAKDEHNNLSWGFFIATDVSIPLGPIVVTGVGGGFFYNPTASDINLIKKLAKVNEIKLESGSNENVIGNKLEVQGGKFAIFLYAKMAVIDDGVIMGRALITITDKQFMFDGRVIMLNLGNYMYGSIHLMVQYSGGFKAEGNIKAVVKYPHVIKGYGEYGFFVYSANQWGVFGKSGYKLFGLIDANSEFYVGNSGFLLAMETGVSIPAGIIDINAGIDVKLWYLKNISWGAYATAYIKAEVLFGAVTAKGWLKAALIKKSSNTFLYGEAGLSVSTFLYDWSGSVYATIKNGKASGGLGSDSEMQALIDEASNTSEKAEAERDAMKNSVENRAEPGVQFSESELTAAFKKLNRIGGKYRYGTTTEQFLAAIYFNGLIQIETEGPVSVNSNEEAYYDRIVQMYMGMGGYTNFGAPDKNDWLEAKNELPDQFNYFNDARADLLANFEETLEEIEGVGNEYQDISNPVTSFVMPSAGEGVDKFIGSGFSLDEAMAQSNEAQMSNGIDNLIEYKREVYNAYAKLNSNIEKVDNILRGSSGAEKFSETYLELRDKIDAAYHNEYAFHNRMMYWAGENANGILSDTTTVNRYMQSKANRCSSMEEMKTYNLDRVSIIAGLSGRDANSDRQTENSAWESNSSLNDYQFSLWGMNRSIELGGKLWSDIPYLGLKALEESSKEKQVEVLSERLTRFNEMGNKQAAFTSKMNQLYSSLTGLYETKYDMVKMLLDWEKSYSTSVYNGTNNLSGYLENRRNLLDSKSLLEAQMALPTISKLEAKNYDRRTYAKVKIDWNTTGARAGFTNYLVSYYSFNPGMYGNSFQAVGGKKSMIFKYLPVEGQTTFSNTSFKLQARNEVGYSIHRSIVFTPTFQYSSSGGSGVTTTSYTTDTTPPSRPGLSYHNYYTGGGVIPCETCDAHNWDFVPYYYIGDSTRLSAKWNSSDHESGIKEYRYKLNKTILPESYNSQDQMNVDESSPESWTNNFQRKNVTINDLNMQHNDVYRIKVVAKNGDDLWSEIGGMKTFLVVDLTKPTTPTIVYEDRSVNTEPWASLSSQYSGYTYSSSPIKPELSSSEINALPPLGAYEDNFDNSEAKIELAWNTSEDSESGIKGYQYQVSKIGNLNSTTEWISVNAMSSSVTLSNSNPKLNNMLNYVDSFKVVLRALNNAGNHSKESEIVLKINDRMCTGIPWVSAHYTSDGNKVILAFTRHAEDKESGIDHYEVRVSSELNGIFDIVSTEESIKIPVNEIGMFHGLFEITIPQRAKSYIAICAVNGNGVRSMIQYKGPFVQNALKPNAPYAEITVGKPINTGNLTGSGLFVTSQKRPKKSKKEGKDSKDGNSLLISFTARTNRATNEIYSVYYKISKQSGNILIDWTKVESNINSVANTLSSLELEDSDEIIVEIKSRNRGGYYSANRSYNYKIVIIEPADDNGKFHIELIGKKIELDMEKIMKGLGKDGFGGSGFDYKVIQVGGGIGGFRDLSGGWVGNGQKSRTSFSLDKFGLKSGMQFQVILQGVNKQGKTVEIESAPFMVP